MPVVNGAFYPDSAKILGQRINQFLDWAEVAKTDKDILALISPHAAYDYSGSVAAYGYKALKGKSIRTVIIIGPSHYTDFDGISVYPHGAWQTPLGNVPVDSELASAIIAGHPEISFYEPAFAGEEHSLEVQIPFLQIVLDDFKIVPILMRRFSYEQCQVLSEALLKAVKNRKDVLVVASTDMSHGHPYEDACRIDNLTIDELKKLNPRQLYYKLAVRECELCGAAPVVTTLLYTKSRGAGDIGILKYATSGDVTGNKEEVVGYLSAAIYAPASLTEQVGEDEAEVVQPGEESMHTEERGILNEEEKKKLLEIARKTIDDYLNTGAIADFKEDNPLLLKKMGAFVTIHNQGRLRGCIGNIIGQQPLYLTVRDMAIEATRDSRFILEPVTKDELPDIDIEISVLSEPILVKNVDEIKMGVHGVIVRKGASSGVFLPQVAEETGWSRDEFLSNLCAHKAGLPPGAWKDGETELYRFTAQVFGEK